VQLALSLFRERESDLIVRNPSERCLTHRLAVHLDAIFPYWDVDCEFNRNGNVPKEIVVRAPKRVGTASDEAVTVFPDIIVHRRGPEGPNLLVIEAKKATSKRSGAFDRIKLVAFKEDFGYKYAAFIVLPAGQERGRETEWL
jgi:hypothetical protein